MSEKTPPGGLRPRPGSHDKLSPEDETLRKEIETLLKTPESAAVLHIQAALRQAKAMEEAAAALSDIADMIEAACERFGVNLDDDEEGEDKGSAEAT